MSDKRYRHVPAKREGPTQSLYCLDCGYSREGATVHILAQKHARYHNHEIIVDYWRTTVYNEEKRIPDAV